MDQPLTQEGHLYAEKGGQCHGDRRVGEDTYLLGSRTRPAGAWLLSGAEGGVRFLLLVRSLSFSLFV